MTTYSQREPHSGSAPVDLAPRGVAAMHYAGELTSRLSEVAASARREAAEHRPPSDAVHMDQHEVAVQADADQALAREHQLYAHVLTETSKAAHDLQQEVPEVENRIRQFLSNRSLQSETAVELAGEKAALVSATEQRMRAEVDLRSFRARHNITEQAVYPESHIWHIGVIAALALAETMVNAFFYENAQGLLGGFFVALAVAVINMGGAFLLGWLFRFKNLTDREKRAAGWVCLPLFLLLTIYCNALFAAFRAEYQLLSDPSNATQVRAAFRAAAEQAGRVFVFGMEFGDLMSFVLFGIGLLLSCVAFYKGYTFDDKYPGHGAKDRAVKAAKQLDTERREAARQKVKELLQRKRRECQALMHEPTRLTSAAGKCAADMQHAVTVFQANQESIQRDFAVLLRSYRDANVSIRATPAPAYFSVVPDLRRSGEDQVVTRVLGILAETRRETEAVRDRHQEPLSSRLNELQHESAKLLDGAFNDYLRSVEQDAEEAINRATITVERARQQVMRG